uniref:Ankyrin repeat and SOCS box containing 5 n=1 Tax=Callorhinchus milii TaxID=7868 RepID=A0A4W3H629_CALMI|eukprot:gi/632956757/ref/XP_007894118.1/ PREDICTED: ankyrin repeat and SOCS box protein 5 isoform X2 [Callorhinchus milii]
MSKNTSTQSNSTNQLVHNRPLYNLEEPSRKRKATWGLLTSQGSWADRSPLHEAASQGRLLSLKTLLAQGQKANTLTIDHVTPLHDACLGKHVACAKALIEAGANTNAITIDGVTPLFNACSSGSAPCVGLLLQNGAKPQGLEFWASAIHEAASKGHSDCVEVLISWGVDIDQDISYLGTPLYVACVHQQLHCMKKLLHAGASVQKGRQQDTPLHAASRQSNLDIVMLLLDFGANISARNAEAKRPVEVAIASSPVDRLLLHYEATPNSLCQLCRLCVRGCLGRSRLNLIPQLELPKLLMDFLHYQ